MEVRRSFFKIDSFKEANKEEGVTLVELVVVIVIVSILATISILFFSNQTREAVKASVKSDVSNNKSQIVNDKNDPRGLYITADRFEDRAVKTSDNTVGYTVSPDRLSACTWGSYSFGTNDVVYYSFDSSTGKMSENPCPTIEGWSTSVLGSDDRVSEPTEEQTPAQEEEPEEEETPVEEEAARDGGVPSKPADYGFTANDERINLSVSVSNNQGNRACFLVEVSTESTTPIEWAVMADTTVEPFRGNTFGSETTNHGSYNIDRQSSSATFTGKYKQWSSKNDVVVAGSPIVLNNICVYGLNVSNAGLLREAQEVRVTSHAATGTSHYATKRFVIEGTSEFAGIWEFEADLADLIQLGGSTRPVGLTDGQFVDIQHISGSKYKVSLKDVAGNQYRSISDGQMLELIFKV